MKPSTKIIVSLAVLIVFISMLMYNEVQDDRLVQAVRNGDFTLRCDLHGGLTDIEPNKVTRLINGVWQFKNGYSKNCYLIKIER